MFCLDCEQFAKSRFIVGPTLTTAGSWELLMQQRISRLQALGSGSWLTAQSPEHLNEFEVLKNAPNLRS